MHQPNRHFFTKEMLLDAGVAGPPLRGLWLRLPKKRAPRSSMKGARIYRQVNAG